MLDQKKLRQNIMTALDLESLPDDKKVALLDKMAQLVERRLALRLVEVLSEEDHEEFEGLKDDPTKADFLGQKISNLEEMIQAEVVNVKQELVNEMESDDELKTLESL